LPANIFSAKIKKKFFSKTKIKFSVKNSRGTTSLYSKGCFLSTIIFKWWRYPKYYWWIWQYSKC